MYITSLMRGFRWATLAENSSAIRIQKIYLFWSLSQLRKWRPPPQYSKHSAPKYEKCKSSCIVSWVIPLVVLEVFPTPSFMDSPLSLFRFSFKPFRLFLSSFPTATAVFRVPTLPLSFSWRVKYCPLDVDTLPFGVRLHCSLWIFRRLANLRRLFLIPHSN